MKPGSLEWEEAMEFFERCVGPQTYGTRFDRTPRDQWKRGQIYGPYENALTSQLFHAFLHGIEYANCTHRMASQS